MTITLDSPSGRTVNELVGELVHGAMWRRKLSQTEFAKQLGITQSALSRKLHGNRPFDIEELLLIAVILELPITALIPKMENPRPDGPDGGSSEPPRGIEPLTYSLQATQQGPERITIPGHVIPLRRVA